MLQRSPVFTACAVVLVLACLLAGCSSNPASGGTAATTSAAPGTVTLKNFAFSPATLTVPPGTTVTWTNEDSATHDVASETGSAVSFASPSLAKGQSFSFTFTKAGTYPYYCTIHPSMKGTIAVQS